MSPKGVTLGQEALCSQTSPEEAAHNPPSSGAANSSWKGARVPHSFLTVEALGEGTVHRVERLDLSLQKACGPVTQTRCDGRRHRGLLSKPRHTPSPL